MALLSAHQVLCAQTPPDTLALARATAAAVASTAYPPQLWADTVIVEATSPWEMLVVAQLQPLLGDTGTGDDGPHWMRFGSHDLTITGDSAAVHVEVRICSRDKDWRDEEKTSFYLHEYGYFFRRWADGWALAKALPFSAGDGTCDPDVAPHEHGTPPSLPDTRLEPTR